MGTRAAPGAPGENRFWVFALSVLVLASVLFFSRLGDQSLQGPEGRWAEITREMQVSGNYFWPTINGAVYYGKPLLSYWLVDASSRLTAHLDEASARYPSAVAGLLGVALLMWLGWRLYDPSTAVLAGFILCTSYSYVFFARLASADMETVVGVVAALLLFVTFEEKPSGWRVVALWLVMAVTSLIKGLLGFALPLLSIGIYSVVADGWSSSPKPALKGSLARPIRFLIMRNRWLFNWRTLPAVALALIVYFLPFAISYVRVGSNEGLHRVFHENVTRYFLPFDHRGPLFLYGYFVFVLMAPWSLFLPAALAQMRSACREKRDRFVLVYFWATFIFFTLSGSRRGYYLLPILPAGSLLVARLFAVPSERLGRWARALMICGYFLLAGLMATVGGASILPAALRPGLFRELPPMPDRAVWVPLLALMIALLAYGWLKLRWSRVVTAISAVAYGSLLFTFVFALPAAERYRSEKVFAQEVCERLGNHMDRLMMYRIWGPGLLFYLSAPEPVPIYGGKMTLGQVLKENPERWVIALGRDIGNLPPDRVALRSRISPWGKSHGSHAKYVLVRPSSAGGDRGWDMPTRLGHE